MAEFLIFILFTIIQSGSPIFKQQSHKQSVLTIKKKATIISSLVAKGIESMEQNQIFKPQHLYNPML